MCFPIPCESSELLFCSDFHLGQRPERSGVRIRNRDHQVMKASVFGKHAHVWSVCVCSSQGVCARLTMLQADVCRCNEVPTEARMFLSANFAGVGWNTSILPSFNSHKSSLVVSPITQPHGAVTPHHVRTYSVFSDLRPLKDCCKTQARKHKDNHYYHHIHARARLFSRFQRVQKKKDEAENKSEQEICWSPDVHKTTQNFLKKHVK